MNQLSTIVKVASCDYVINLSIVASKIAVNVIDVDLLIR